MASYNVKTGSWSKSGSEKRETPVTSEQLAVRRQQVYAEREEAQKQVRQIEEQKKVEVEQKLLKGEGVTQAEAKAFQKDNRSIIMRKHKGGWLIDERQYRPPTERPDMVTTSVPSFVMGKATPPSAVSDNSLKLVSPWSQKVMDIGRRDGFQQPVLTKDYKFNIRSSTADAALYGATAQTIERRGTALLKDLATAKTESEYYERKVKQYDVAKGKVDLADAAAVGAFNKKWGETFKGLDSAQARWKETESRQKTFEDTNQLKVQAAFERQIAEDRARQTENYKYYQDLNERSQKAEKNLLGEGIGFVASKAESVFDFTASKLKPFMPVREEPPVFPKTDAGAKAKMAYYASKKDLFGFLGAATTLKGSPITFHETAKMKREREKTIKELLPFSASARDVSEMQEFAVTVPVQESEEKEYLVESFAFKKGKEAEADVYKRYNEMVKSLGLDTEPTQSTKPPEPSARAKALEKQYGYLVARGERLSGLQKSISTRGEFDLFEPESVQLAAEQAGLFGVAMAGIVYAGGATLPVAVTTAASTAGLYMGGKTVGYGASLLEPFVAEEYTVFDSPEAGKLTFKGKQTVRPLGEIAGFVGIGALAGYGSKKLVGYGQAKALEYSYTDIKTVFGSKAEKGIASIGSGSQVSLKGDVSLIYSKQWTPAKFKGGYFDPVKKAILGRYLPKPVKLQLVADLELDSYLTGQYDFGRTGIDATIWSDLKTGSTTSIQSLRVPKTKIPRWVKFEGDSLSYTKIKLPAGAGFTPEKARELGIGELYDIAGGKTTTIRGTLMGLKETYPISETVLSKTSGGADLITWKTPKFSYFKGKTFSEIWGLSGGKGTSYVKALGTDVAGKPFRGSLEFRSFLKGFDDDIGAYVSKTTGQFKAVKLDAIKLPTGISFKGGTGRTTLWPKEWRSDFITRAQVSGQVKLKQLGLIKGVNLDAVITKADIGAAMARIGGRMAGVAKTISKASTAAKTAATARLASLSFAGAGAGLVATTTKTLTKTTPKISVPITTGRFKQLTSTKTGLKTLGVFKDFTLTGTTAKTSSLLKDITLTATKPTTLLKQKPFPAISLLSPISLTGQKSLLRQVPSISTLYKNITITSPKYQTITMPTVTIPAFKMAFVKPPTPIKPRPFPLILPQFFGGKRKEKAKKVKGYDVFGIKGKRPTRLSAKTHTKNKALGIGARWADESSGVTFKIKQKGHVIKPKMKDLVWQTLSGKFRKKGNTYIERNKYRIDSPGELQEITFKGLDVLAKNPLLKASKSKRKSFMLNNFKGGVF